MKIYLLIIILVLIFIAGCTTTTQQAQEISCNKPYIPFAATCCLDENDNSICDNDENKTSQECETCKDEIRYVETIIERIIYLEGNCRKVNFTAELGICSDKEITFENTGKFTLESLDVDLFNKEEEKIDSRRFRVQIISHRSKIYEYDEVIDATKAIITPTVRIDDEIVECEAKEFELTCRDL